ncbi:MULTISPECIES: fluoride efflux transporter FluC [Geobacillus]|jgi:fluoride exporter|uniref:Fluoride-specific ion channel FluC n=2 Tax=Geobacillus thermodenitrificans TaxID=33940 RepID=A4IRM1_GEOTN|nr:MULTISPECIES: CrcB family protein [Geobacillus]ABO67975.1 CrcB protein [Geobacillus thermodenitrificans NG80-2]ARA98862.1 chromosome condensation protein CrcB [Geobacillus thermodenitrificans]ARP43723.1 Putative fluoride ion transporter CrcB 1 [Geobacillus thermodenitrificans]ATO38230.1 chromosome condensation protein CrcB [Geobacillus thermodenitrificans]KQB92271.1 chromosome condensation protein CrcB [Geobacillus sp. PA-3]
MVYVAVGIAGMIGALVRYALGLAVPAAAVGGFPLGTLLMNWTGAFLLSWLTVVFTCRPTWPTWWKTAMTTGFVGSYTTFSTLSVECVELMEQGAWGAAAVYIAASLFGGLFASWAGYAAAQRSDGGRKEGVES